LSLQTHDALERWEEEQMKYANGLVTKFTDDRGFVSDFHFDAMSRMINITETPDTIHEASETYFYNVAPNDNYITVTDEKGRVIITKLNATGNPIQTQTYDSKGNLKTVNESFYNEFGLLFKKVEYDWVGENEDQEISLTTLFEYDENASLKKVTHQDGKVELYDQNIPNLHSLYVLQGLMVEEKWYNESGQVIEKKTTTPQKMEVLAHTIYTYDTYHNLKTTTDTAGHITTYFYDDLDRMERVEKTLEGNVVSTIYEYDPSSRDNLITKISLDDIVLGTRSYDGLKRLKEERRGKSLHQYSYDNNFPMPKRAVTPKGDQILFENNTLLNMVDGFNVEGNKELFGKFTHDPKGLELLNENNGQGFNEYFYNSIGQLYQENFTFHKEEDRVFQASYHASLGGRPLKKTDYFGYETFFTYNVDARLMTVRYQDNKGNILTETSLRYDDYGRIIGYDILKETQSIQLDLELNAIGLETQRSFKLDSKQLITIEQDYTKDLQIKQRRYLQDDKTTEENMTYDKWHRLSSYQCIGDRKPKDRYGNAISAQIFKYDKYGNICQSNTNFEGGSSNESIFEYEPENPVQLKSLTNTHPQYPSNIELRYDESGNLLTDELERQYVYNALNQLQEVRDKENQLLGNYYYDVSGNLISQNVAGKGSLQMLYTGSTLSHEFDDKTQVHYHESSPVTLRRVEQGGEELKSEMLLTNVSGSIISQIITSPSALEPQIIQRTYSAYGAEEDQEDLELLIENLLGFNGERKDPVTQLYLLGNYRVYNPHLMRFHSQDSMSPFGKGGINSYAYCMGDPVNFKDPSGHFALLALLIGTIVGAAVAAAVEGITCAVTGKDFDWKQVGIGALTGAIGGVFGAAAVGAKTGLQIGLAVTDIGISGSAEFGINVATGMPADEAGIQAGIGAAIGLLTFGIGKGAGKFMRGNKMGIKSLGRTKNMTKGGQETTEDSIYTDNFRNTGEEALLVHGSPGGNLTYGNISRFGAEVEESVDPTTFVLNIKRVYGIDLTKSGSGKDTPIHLVACHAKTSGAAQKLADTIQRPVIAYGDGTIYTGSGIGSPNIPIFGSFLKRFNEIESPSFSITTSSMFGRIVPETFMPKPARIGYIERFGTRFPVLEY
jgi:RHS repeat-associated protein